MILYNIRRTTTGFLMAKFDEDFNVEAVYEVTAKTCTCPAAARPSCKHRKMIPIMASRADTDEFYCYETQTWHRPLAPEGVEPMVEKLDAFYATVEEIAEGPVTSELTIASNIELPEDADVAEEFSKLLHNTKPTAPTPIKELAKLTQPKAPEPFRRRI